MTVWAVIGPEYGTVIPVTDEGQGPMEYGCDYVEVEAETRADARVLGVKLLKCEPYLQDDPSVNPFKGVRVQPVGVCSHGVVMIESARCLRCEAEWEAQDILLGVNW